MINQQLITKIKSAKRVAVLTGAGISAESGIPTFRGAGGYWRNYRAEDLATPEAFARDPKLVWEWYAMRMQVCLDAKPNPGHEIVAKMEFYFPEFLLVTQKIRFDFYYWNFWSSWSARSIGKRSNRSWFLCC
jgi:NAD-dependent deacetylase